MAILIIIAALVVYFVTQYDTLAIILGAIGGLILLFQLLFFGLVAKRVSDAHDAFDSRWP